MILRIRVLIPARRAQNALLLTDLVLERSSSTLYAADLHQIWLVRAHRALNAALLTCQVLKCTGRTSLAQCFARLICEETGMARLALCFLFGALEHT